MFRLMLIAAAVLAITATTAQAQSNCETSRRACLRNNLGSCQQIPDGPERAQCREDVDTSCSKEFSRCLGDGASAPTGTQPTGSSSPSRQCEAVFSSLRSYAEANPANRIHVVWTTNYYAHNVRFAGWSEIRLRSLGTQQRDLVGEGERRRTVFGGRADTISGSDVEKVLLRVRADNKIVFQEQYGPYEPTCSGRWFAEVRSGDSLEAFSFKPSFNVQRVPPDATPPGPTPPEPSPPPQFDQTSRMPDGARQWRVANTDTLKGNEPYELHNLRRRELNLTSQLGSVRNDGGSFGSAFDDLGWVGSSGGHFVFARTNARDHRAISEQEVVALYNTRSKKYLTGTVNNGGRRWSTRPSYEWTVRGRTGADFALYNTNARDHLVLNETRSRPNEELTYLDCAKKWSAYGCAMTYRRPPEH